MGRVGAGPPRAARSGIHRQLERLGIEARTARVGEGMSQSAIAARAGVSQRTVGRVESGDPRISVMIVGRVVAALGMDFSIRAYPGSGVPLRDSGQIALTHSIRTEAHHGWRISLETPVGDETARAADMLLLSRSFGIHVEIETRLLDLQAQVRKGKLKRDALERKLGVRLAFVLALGESQMNRAAISSAAEVVRMALPAPSREVLAALRNGTRLSQDGLLWVRVTPRRRHSSHR